MSGCLPVRHLGSRSASLWSPHRLVYAHARTDPTLFCLARLFCAAFIMLVRLRAALYAQVVTFRVAMPSPRVIAPASHAHIKTGRTAMHARSRMPHRSPLAQAWRHMCAHRRIVPHALWCGACRATPHTTRSRLRTCLLSRVHAHARMLAGSLACACAHARGHDKTMMTCVRARRASEHAPEEAMRERRA